MVPADGVLVPLDPSPVFRSIPGRGSSEFPKAFLFVVSSDYIESLDEVGLVEPPQLHPQHLLLRQAQDERNYVNEATSGCQSPPTGFLNPQAPRHLTAQPHPKR